MKWVKAIVCLALIGVFVYYANVLKGKSPETLFNAPPPMAVVKAGTEVPMLLLTPLDSGSTKVGSEVKFVVAEDVKSTDGRVVVPQGSIATGKVTKSRTATLGAVFLNQPARLEIEFKSVKASDGSLLVLTPSESKEGFEFTAANTNRKGSGNVVDAVSDPEARDLVVSAAKKIITGESSSNSPESDKQWKELAERYGLQDTQKFMKGDAEGHRATDIPGVLSAVQKGDLKGLTGTDILLVAKAAGEIVDLGSGIDKSVRGIFKGSNIHAQVGTRVTAVTAKDAKVRPKQ